MTAADPRQARDPSYGPFNSSRALSAEIVTDEAQHARDTSIREGVLRSMTHPSCDFSSIAGGMAHSSSAGFDPQQSEGEAKPTWCLNADAPYLLFIATARASRCACLLRSSGVRVALRQSRCMQMVPLGSLQHAGGYKAALAGTFVKALG